MAKYNEYTILHYNERTDGRVEAAGTERVVLTRDEAIELSYTAIVLAVEGFGGKPIVIREGKHTQFDSHLGWLS